MKRSPAIVLAGGLGTRLRELNPDVPKPMIEVNKKPFLHWFIQRHIDMGFKEFILSTGYKSEVIESYSWKKSFPKIKFDFVREEKPLGTGGAILEILKAHDLESFWVLNGDTLLSKNLPAEKLEKDEGGFYCVMDGTQIFDAKPNLFVQEDRVMREGVNGTHFDAGAVFLTKECFPKSVMNSGWSTSTPALHLVLKTAMSEKRIGFRKLSGTCYDIGTPARYERFEEYLKES